MENIDIRTIGGLSVILSQASIPPQVVTQSLPQLIPSLSKFMLSLSSALLTAQDLPQSTATKYGNTMTFPSPSFPTKVFSSHLNSLLSCNASQKSKPVFPQSTTSRLMARQNMRTKKSNNIFAPSLTTVRKTSLNGLFLLNLLITIKFNHLPKFLLFTLSTDNTFKWKWNSITLQTSWQLTTSPQLCKKFILKFKLP